MGFLRGFSIVMGANGLVFVLSFLNNKLLYLSPADVYGEGLTEREQRRGRAAHSILKAQKRRFAHPANVAAEMMKLSHLTEGEEWARILSSRPSELC